MYILMGVIIFRLVMIAKTDYVLSCLIRKYQTDLNEEREERSSAEFRIMQELELRLQREKISYDL